MGGGWKIPQDEISGGPKNPGVGSLGLLSNNQCKYKKLQLASLEANTFWNLATCSISHSLFGQLNTTTDFLQVSPRKIKNVISGSVGKFSKK